MDQKNLPVEGLESFTVAELLRDMPCFTQNGEVVAMVVSCKEQEPVDKERFEELWSSWPGRKARKQDAKKKFNTLRRSNPSIADEIGSWLCEVNRNGGFSEGYVPLLANVLSKKLWEEDPESHATGNRKRKVPSVSSDW